MDLRLSFPRRIRLACLAAAFLIAPVLSEAGLILPSEAGYAQVYGLNLGIDTNLQTSAPSYYLDNSAAFPNGSFKRVAYHLELQSGAGPLEYVWVSMDTFTNDATKLGVPSVTGSNSVFQQTVSNVNVFSNKPGVVTGTGITTANIEFWPYNYGTGNSLGIPGASTSAFDFGDAVSTSTTTRYGSMQIHNYGASQTLLAFNNSKAATVATTWESAISLRDNPTGRLHEMPGAIPSERWMSTCLSRNRPPLCFSR